MSELGDGEGTLHAAALGAYTVASTCTCCTGMLSGVSTIHGESAVVHTVASRTLRFPVA